MRKQLSLTLEPSTYREMKNEIPPRQVSPLVNNLLKEYLKKKKQKRLIASYKKTAQSKAVKAEDKIWEGSIEDGINE